MNERSLIILMTRLGGEVDEWESVWGFQPLNIFAFIRSGEITLVDSEKLSSINLYDQIDQDDVWVINGRQFHSRKLHEALNKISWSQVKRKIMLRIHLGGGASVKDSDFQETINSLTLENLKYFLQQAEDYSLAGKSPSSHHPVVRFANLIKQRLWSEYDRILRKLEIFFLSPDIRLGILKHRLNHLFLPIDIDLQGWKESDFDEQYGQEIVKAYTEKGENVLNRAWKLIYGDPNDREADNVEKIVNQARQSDRAEWRMVQALLPAPDGAMPESENEEKNQLAEARKLFAQTKEVLDSIQDQGRLDALKSRLTSNNPFHKWFVALDKALDDLRNAMQDK